MQSLLDVMDRVSIRKQMVTVCAVLALGIAGAVAAGAAYVARAQAVQDARGELLSLARNMADRLDAHMAERFREVRNVAGLGVLTRTWSDGPGEIRTVLDQIQVSLPEYAWIGFATPDGIVRSATRRMLEGASVAARPWFIQGLTHPTVQDVHPAKLLESLLPVRPDAAPFRFVDVAVPVYGAGGLLAGVLGAHLSWFWADEVRHVVLASQDAAGATDIWVLAADGTVLLGPHFDAHPFTPEQLQRSTFTDRTGQDEVLTAIYTTAGQADDRGLGWRIVARRPVATALEPAARLTRIILGLGALAALAGIAIAWVIGTIMSRPIAKLTYDVGQIGRTATAGLAVEHGSSEIVTLSIALRSLLRRLGSAEQRVNEAEHRAEEARTGIDATLRDAEEKNRRLGEDIEILRLQADTDPLTGLLNRRAFLPFADDAMHHFRRHGRPVAIIMFDIDRFKSVNDTFGHAVGDVVITTVGRIIKDQIRTTDKLARFGGEEFVVMLRECDGAGADLLANRILTLISETLLDFDGIPLQVTVSGGIAVAKSTDRDIQDVIQRADGGLYQAKSMGRNRVRHATGTAPPLAQAA